MRRGVHTDGVPIRLRITAFYKSPKSSKKKTELMEKGFMRPLKRPDADNVIKIIADSLNGVAYRDDAAIVETHIEKYYTSIRTSWLYRRRWMRGRADMRIGLIDMDDTRVFQI